MQSLAERLGALARERGDDEAEAGWDEAADADVAEDLEDLDGLEGLDEPEAAAATEDAAELPEIPLAVAQEWAAARSKLGGRARGARRRLAKRVWQCGAATFLVAAVGYGLTAGGHVQRLAAELVDGTSAAAMRAGFTVQRLTIEGQNRTRDEDILAALGVGTGASMLSLDTAAARARLERLPWVRQAQIMRLLPSTLHVAVEEREPFAAWQLDGKLHLVDAEGRVLMALAERPPNLPLIVGEGAAVQARALFASLAAYPELRSRVAAAVRVAERRWTLKLLNDVEIRLPEDGLELALDKLADLDRSHGLLSGDIVAVDLRLPDRVSLRLTADAAARWAEATRAGERGRPRTARDT